MSSSGSLRLPRSRMMPRMVSAFRISRTSPCWSSDHLSSLPKPECHHSGSATKPDARLWPHPAPQQHGVCHTDLSSESHSLFFARGTADEPVGGGVFQSC